MAILLKGALAGGYPTELWTLGRVAQVIRREFHVRYHPGHLWRVLGKMGWSCQKPERLARERDEEAVRQWRYKPQMLNGQPIEVITTITVNFTFQQ